MDIPFLEHSLLSFNCQLLFSMFENVNCTLNICPSNRISILIAIFVQINIIVTYLFYVIIIKPSIHAQHMRHVSFHVGSTRET